MTKEEIKAVQKVQDKCFAIGGILMAFSIVLGCYFDTPVFVISMMIGVFGGLWIFDMVPNLAKCGRCGEYYQHGHEEDICLHNLKIKLDKIER